MKYTKEEIKEIKQICEKYKANDYMYPLFLLIINLTMLCICIYLLYAFRNSQFVMFYILLT